MRQPEPATPSSDRLITLAQQGDRHAFSELVRQEYARVIRVVYRLCGDPQLAEDAAQEAFIRSWQHLPRFKPGPDAGRSFRNWVLRIANNVALDMLRRERPNLELETQPLASKNPGPERQFVQAEQANRVQQAILAISPASRAALILREVEQMSYQEIAETLEIPLGTVMSRLSYARQQLRRALASDLEDWHE
ncbi:MAG: sigma-70 family RNA polymerase sigma factor [Anaerolineales bacterium]|nr:sigma-70 family RNA polymerase sigma factor [Anaerolineales bacterium]